MNRSSKPPQRQTDRLLNDWDSSIDSVLMQKLKKLNERRAFLAGMLKSGAMVASIPMWSSLAACDRQVGQQALIKQHPWQTFAAIQQQLFPADGNGPSASDLNATLYLKFVLDAPDTDIEDKVFILDGIKWLNELTDKQYGKAFVVLNNEQQGAALRMIAGSQAGERWLSHLLLYIMEALLTDPVYGGNPEGIGWHWLEHQPGFPRPSKDKRYPELL